ATSISNGETPLPDPNEKFPTQYLDTYESAYLALVEMWEHPDKVFAIDIESSDLDVFTDELLEVAVANAKEAWVFEASVLLDPRCKRGLVAMFESDEYFWWLHNLQFDFQWFKHYFGAVPKHASDTMAWGLGTTERA